MSDGIVYAVKPTGHETPESERKVIVPNRELENVLNLWLRVAESKGTRRQEDEVYHIAVDMIHGLEKVTVEEANALLLAQCAQMSKRIPLFVSAVYNHLCDEAIIDFNLTMPTPPQWMAYDLKEGKVFVNRGVLGDSTGFNAKGTLVNYGRVGGFFGNKALLVLNLGEAGDSLGYWGGVGEGVTINYGTAGSTHMYRGLTFVHAGNNPVQICGDDGSKIFAVQQTKTDERCHRPLYNQEWCAQRPFLAYYFEELRQALERGRNNPHEIKDVLCSLHPDDIRQVLDIVVETSVIMKDPQTVVHETKALEKRVRILNQLIRYNGW